MKIGRPIIINRTIEEPREMSSIINIDTESLINLINKRFDSLKNSIDVEVGPPEIYERISMMESRINSVTDTSTKLAAENESLHETIECQYKRFFLVMSSKENVSISGCLFAT